MELQVSGIMQDVANELKAAGRVTLADAINEYADARRERASALAHNARERIERATGDVEVAAARVRRIARDIEAGSCVELTQ